jgi:DNA-binding NarL/FixJ family response regulator/PAS domain-containing protein
VALVEHASTAAVTDGNGRVVEIDDGFELLFEVTREDALGKQLAELVIAPRFRAAYRALLREASDENGDGDGDATASASRTSEVAVLGARGGERQVELSIARTAEDPTRITTRLRVPRARLRDGKVARGAVLQNQLEQRAGIGSWELELETGELECSDNLFRLLGLEPRRPAPTLDYLVSHAHPRDRERMLQAREALRRGGHIDALRFRYVLPDGRVRHMQAATSLVARAAGTRGRAYGTLQDLTAQRVAEQELGARLAVSDLLANWRPGDDSLRSLLRDLGEPLDFELGALWVRDGDARVVRALWQSDAVARPERELRMREARRPLRAGLVGAAWQTGRPVSVVAMARTHERAERLEADLQGALALPATLGDDVLAVLSLAARDKVALTDRLMRSLRGISHELGQFFARRRGELTGAPLTRRELEVLQMFAVGGSRSEIAARLHVSESTIKTHLEHIYDKLGAHDRAAAVGTAMRQGLIA